MTASPQEPSFLARVSRGSAGLADQVVSAGTHFVIQIYAARNLGVEGYGVFAVAYAILVLCQMVHNALIVEPLIVFGAGLSRPRFRRHVGLGLHLHARVLAASTAVVIPAAVWIAQLSVGKFAAWIVSLFAAVVSTLTMLLFRRALQSSRRFHAALAGTIAYSLLVALAIGTVNTSHLTLRAELLFGILSGAAAVVVAGQYIALRPRAFPRDSLHATRKSEMIRYGGWAAGGTAVWWLGSAAPYLLLPTFSSISEAAVFRAGMNLFLPFQHVLLGITAVLLPTLARRFARGQVEETQRWVSGLAVILGSLGLLYGVTTSLLARPAVAMIYGDEFGENVVNAIQAGFLLPFVWAALFLQITVLRALGRSDAVFKANALAFAIVGAGGMLLGSLHGAIGAAIALTALQVAKVIGTTVGLRNIREVTLAAKGGAPS